jgi:hypothetical protein
VGDLKARFSFEEDFDGVYVQEKCDMEMDSEILLGFKALLLYLSYYMRHRLWCHVVHQHQE